jgi:hypothetical protein
VSQPLASPFARAALYWSRRQRRRLWRPGLDSGKASRLSKASCCGADKWFMARRADVRRTLMPLVAMWAALLAGPRRGVHRRAVAARRRRRAFNTRAVRTTGATATSQVPTSLDVALRRDAGSAGLVGRDDHHCGRDGSDRMIRFGGHSRTPAQARFGRAIADHLLRSGQRSRTQLSCGL